MSFNSYTFNPGINEIVYLPIDGRINFFESTFKAGLTGGSLAVERCYGKYGVKWKWSTFESTASAINALSSLQPIYPSTWSSMQCTLSAGTLIVDTPGAYPKKWTAEKPLSSSLFNPSFIECVGSNITWTLSSQNWSVQQIVPLSVSEKFNFELRFLDYGQQIYTTSIHQNTNFTLTAKLSVQCIDTTSTPLTTESTEIVEAYNFTTIAPPQLNIYTPNKFILSGATVGFQNLFTSTNFITGLLIDFDDGKTLFLSGEKIKTYYFNTKYDILGFKTLKITAYTTYPAQQTYTVQYPNIIQVLDKYDTISPQEYRTANEPILLPHSEQPTIGSNDWVVEDNINVCFKEFYKNLEYLDSRSKTYNSTYSNYTGYLGPLPTVIGGTQYNPKWTWEDADCLNTYLDYDITWRKLLSADNPLDSGEFVSYGTWQDHICPVTIISFDCTQRSSLTGIDCLQWSWKARKSTNVSDVFEFVTWKDARSTGKNIKQWKYDICPSEDYIICEEGVWNVNIPGINDYYNDFGNTAIQPRCIYYSVATKNNKIYTNQKTQIKLLSSDYSATFYAKRKTLDGLREFSDLKTIRLDSNDKIFVLDNILSQVGVFKYDKESRGDDWTLMANWGGVGSGLYKFSNPKDLHVDQYDNVWVVDAGNFSVKHYSNTGTWIKTIQDDVFKNSAPLSVCVDSQSQIHVLTNKQIRVYSYEGNFLFAYNFSDKLSENSPRRINTSHNREIIYLATNKQVLKFFRNGVFSGYIINNKDKVFNIQDIYQDEYRNLLIATNDKILKYVDLMSQTQIRGSLPENYWTLNDILIHKEEYIQNWVYSKSFQRLWDNIEIFRNSLYFDNTKCKSYRPPLYGKDDMIIGQNEIVTSAVINRVLGYLWANLNTLLDYFDPYCEE